MRSLLSAFIALGAFQALAVTAQDPACLANCAAQVRADFTKFACANADDAGCLCAKADFKNGVRDCATPCGSAGGDVDTFLNDGFCLAQAPPPEAPSSQPPAEPEATQPTEPQTTAAPETTAVPETTAPPEPATTAEPEEQPQPTPSSVTTEEELLQDTSSQPVVPETTAAPETTSAAAETESSTTLSTKTTAAGNAGETGAADNDETNEDKNDEGGLSKTAVIGIGVGAGAAGLAVVGLLLWFCLRKRNKQDARPFIEISKPMPSHGTGDYTGRRDPFAEKRGEVIEMQTNRYEDMLPRQEPRTVV